MPLAESVTEERRSMILRYLLAEPDHMLSDAMVQKALAVSFRDFTRDTIRADMAWLEEQELVDTSVLGEKLMAAVLTDRGVDVAEGRAKVPGLKQGKR